MVFTTKDLARQSRNQMSEYLSQRRKGRKGRRKNVKIIRKNIYFSSFELGDVAPWREEYPNPRCFPWRKIFANRKDAIAKN
jgi:hypothetical protein